MAHHPLFGKSPEFAKAQIEYRIKYICATIDFFWLDILQELKLHEITQLNELMQVNAWLNKIPNLKNLDGTSKISKQKVIEDAAKLSKITADMMEDGESRLKDINNQINGIWFKYEANVLIKEIRNEEKLCADKVKRIEESVLTNWVTRMQTVFQTLLNETSHNAAFCEQHTSKLASFKSIIYQEQVNSRRVIDLSFEQLGKRIDIYNFSKPATNERTKKAHIVHNYKDYYKEIEKRLDTLPTKMEELRKVLSGAITKYKSYQEKIGDVYYSGWVPA